MASSTPVLDPPDRDQIDSSARRDVRHTPFVRPPASSVQFDRSTPYFLYRLRRDKTALAATCLLATMIVSAILAPLLSPHDADTIDFARQRLTPSWQHPFGTDDLGRDVLVRVLRGGRISLAAGISATLFALLIGVVAGAVSGYRGGFTDTVIMRVTDFALSMPIFFVVLLLASITPPGFLVICLLIGMTHWMEVARVVRSVVISTRRHEFVTAARALGIPGRRILVYHILSHTSGPLLVAGTIGVAQAIMLESTLSFLGFGAQPPNASWGSMLSNAQGHLATAPWMAIFPGLMIFLSILCCYVLGDFLRATLAPDSQ